MSMTTDCWDLFNLKQVLCNKEDRKVCMIIVTECNVMHDYYLKEINNKKFYCFIVLITYSHCCIKKFIVEFKNI